MKLDLSGHVVLPGLINAHDHLEFNLFPRLGRGPYANAGEWARDIYHPARSPVREHLRVPMRVRLWWGALKNLLSGVTTVCHHNPYHADVFNAEFPVRVVRRFAWAHSLEFEPDRARRFRSTPADRPVSDPLRRRDGCRRARRNRALDALGCALRANRDRPRSGAHSAQPGTYAAARRGADLVPDFEPESLRPDRVANGPALRHPDRAGHRFRAERACRPARRACGGAPLRARIAPAGTGDRAARADSCGCPTTPRIGSRCAPTSSDSG